MPEALEDDSKLKIWQRKQKRKSTEDKDGGCT